MRVKTVTIYWKGEARRVSFVTIHFLRIYMQNKKTTLGIPLVIIHHSAK